MKISILTAAVILCAPVFLTGCMTAPEHRAAVQDDNGQRVTVGTVQRKIRVGMSGAGVAEVLGSPNIVSTDEQSREVWIYDKISTNRVVSSSRGGASILILGGGSQAGASSTQQKTLTIIIKFDKSKKVREFAYHTSRF